MRGKSFKSQIDDLVREVQAEAETFARRMGFTVSRGLVRAIKREESYWSEQGCYGVLDLESASSEELRYAMFGRSQSGLGAPVVFVG